MKFYLVEPINYTIFTPYKEYKATEQRWDVDSNLPYTQIF